MASKRRAELEGAAELQRLLDQLPAKVQRKVSRAAISAGLTPILRAMRKGVPVKEGTLKKSLGRKVKAYPKTYTTVGLAGPKKYAAPHAHLVEYGTGPRYDKDGNYAGQMPPNPFVRKARDEQTTAAATAVAKKVKEGVHREAAKAAAGGGR
jgi:HK97 gp10 family phage protein